VTKYILTGGKDRIPSDYGRNLRAEFKKTHDTFKILSCFFSAPAEQWEVMAKNWGKWFREKVGDVKAYDFAKLDSLADQAKLFDVLYFHGGNTRLLIDTMREFENLRSVFKNKLIVGSSAGANMLAKNFWSSSKQKPFRGLGILDINVMVHYGIEDHDGIHRTAQDWENEEKAFREFIRDDGKIWHIPEREFIVFEVAD
jgi:peptidase S51-like protein